ncbi:MAG: hypothetical protein E4G89_04000 [Methanothrix sp.]|nr:MAG: hypothetical protein E4G89_04000 [Methanothrix sp.]
MSKWSKRLSLGVLLVGLVLVSMSWAASGDKAQAQKEISPDKPEIAQAKQALNEFKESIDRWHMANLEGDPAKIERHQSQIYAIIRADIKQSQAFVQRREKEAGQSAGDLQGTNCREQPQDLRADLMNLKSARQLVMVKENLFLALKRSQTFSNKYRLLNDYVELLQRESGVVRMELAEDGREARQGK